MKGERGRKSRKEGHPYFLACFSPFNEAPVFSVPFQTTKSFLSAPEGTRVGRSEGGKGKENSCFKPWSGLTQGSRNRSGRLRPEQVIPEEQGASQWVGLVGKREGRENLCGISQRDSRSEKRPYKSKGVEEEGNSRKEEGPAGVECPFGGRNGFFKKVIRF